MLRWQSALRARTAALQAEQRWREPDANPRAAAASVADGMVDVTSNDYLGLASSSAPAGVERPSRAPALGAGSSRLVRGTHLEHRALERDLAEWLGFEDCLLFSSGYAANVGLISALAGADDVVVSDSLNHASIIDGCRLSRATVKVVAHRDLREMEREMADAAAQGRVCWVVSESYFSMDGDSPALGELAALCRQNEAALVVDEAHALGVFGPQGSGMCAAQGVRADVLVGGLGKAVGGQGGFVASSREVRAWLWNRARSFMFSTGVSPWLSAVTRERLACVRGADGQRAHLTALAAQLRSKLLGARLTLPDGQHGPLVPVIVGAEQRALDAAVALRSKGFQVQAIRPPTVPAGTSRLRIALHAGLTVEQVRRLGDAVVEVLAGMSGSNDAS